MQNVIDDLENRYVVSTFLKDMFFCRIIIFNHHISRLLVFSRLPIALIATKQMGRSDVLTMKTRLIVAVGQLSVAMILFLHTRVRTVP